jgi:phosphocarrier protein HPr
MSNTLILELEVKNKHGLHARPSAKLSKLLHSFQSSVSITKEGKIMADKNLLDIMKMGGKQGTLLTFHITGIDAQACATALQELFDNKLGDSLEEKSPLRSPH